MIISAHSTLICGRGRGGCWVGLKIGENQKPPYAGKQGKSSVHTRFNLFLKILIDWDVTTEAPSVLQYFKAYSPNFDSEFLEKMPL